MSNYWKEVQAWSNEILSDGLFLLKNVQPMPLQIISYAGFGNYLICYAELPVYIGESNNIKSRLSQHFAPTGKSTFYKNYLSIKSDLATNLIKSDFIPKYIETSFGRKEIEEFGIVNLPTALNKFQLDKRTKFSIQSHEGLWMQAQINASNILEAGEEEVLSQRPAEWFEVNITTGAGIYLIEHRNELIYIGESSNVVERHSTHSKTTYFSALRRNLGESLLSFELQTIDGKKRYFSNEQDELINQFLRDCKIRILPVQLGRYELEEYLIKKHQPILNRKGKQSF